MNTLSQLVASKVAFQELFHRGHVPAQKPFSKDLLTLDCPLEAQRICEIIRREVLQKFTIEENRFGFEPEITAKIAKSKCRIYEVGISYHGRTYAEGKKISWKDGFRALYCIIKYNLFR